MNISKIIELISELIRRYRDGELRGEVEKSADAWYRSYESVDDNENDCPWSDEELNQIQTKTLKQAYNAGAAQPLWGLWLRVAASLAFAVLLTYVGFTVWKRPMRKEVAGAMPREVLLPDGSRVKLAAESILMYPENFSEKERRITLTGDAFFEVTKDRTRPFIIICGELETKVLGTSFDIDSEPSGDVSVVVVSGSVALSSAKNSVVLRPHERGVFMKAQNTISKSVAGNTTWNSILNKHGNLNFNNARFSDVMHTLEVRFDITFNLKDAEGIGNCMFTADLSGQSLKTALDLAAQSLYFKYHIDGHTINIHGKGCP